MIKQIIMEVFGKKTNDLAKSILSLAKYNGGEWKSDKQRDFFLNIAFATKSGKKYHEWTGFGNTWTAWMDEEGISKIMKSNKTKGNRLHWERTPDSKEIAKLNRQSYPFMNASEKEAQHLTAQKDTLAQKAVDKINQSGIFNIAGVNIKYTVEDFYSGLNSYTKDFGDASQYDIDKLIQESSDLTGSNKELYDTFIEFVKNIPINLVSINQGPTVFDHFKYEWREEYANKLGNFEIRQAYIDKIENDPIISQFPGRKRH